MKTYNISFIFRYDRVADKDNAYVVRFRVPGMHRNDNDLYGLIENVNFDYKSTLSKRDGSVKRIFTINVDDSVSTTVNVQYTNKDNEVKVSELKCWQITEIFDPNSNDYSWIDAYDTEGGAQ